MNELPQIVENAIPPQIKAMYNLLPDEEKQQIISELNAIPAPNTDKKPSKTKILKQLCQAARKVAPRHIPMTKKTEIDREVFEKLKNDLNDQLYLVDVLILEQAQCCLKRAKWMLEERGMYKMRYKQLFRIVEDICDKAVKNTNDINRDWTERSCFVVGNAYAPQFMDYGGSFNVRLSSAFDRLKGAQMKTFYFSLKNMLDAQKVKHSDIIAEILMVRGLMHAGAAFYVRAQQKLANFSKGNIVAYYPRKPYPAAIGNATTPLLDLFIDKNKELTEHETSESRTCLNNLCNYLLGNDIQKFFHAQLDGFHMEYIEFYLAALRLDLEEKTVPRMVICQLIFRMGTADKVRDLLHEVLQMSMPTEDMDLWDYAHSLNEQPSGPMMNEFRRLCMQNKHLFYEEPEDVQMKRMYRQLARKNHGMLNDKSIYAIFITCGTKKATLEYMTATGEALLPTIRKVKKMKVAELKALASSFKE